jgi:ABC-type multidrug transport system ATPase subunit
MNILCGMFEQSSGSIKMYDYDTREHMDYLRQLISYCPQRMFFHFMEFIEINLFQMIFYLIC